MDFDVKCNEVFTETNNCFNFLLIIVILNLKEVIMSYKVGVIIEKDEDGYYAYCPELEGCQT